MLVWITVAGVAMAAISLVGSFTLVLSEAALKRLLPLVALAAGSLLGLVAWLVAAAHEVPQALGDFGILVHSGWSRRAALLFNLLSGLTFLFGALIAYALSGALDVALLLPFAAGNFLYIAVSDLLPQLRSEALGAELVQFAVFCAGLLLLGALAAAWPS